MNASIVSIYQIEMKNLFFYMFFCDHLLQYKRCNYLYNLQYSENIIFLFRLNQYAFMKIIIIPPALSKYAVNTNITNH